MEVEPLLQGYTALNGATYPIIASIPQYGPALTYYVKVADGVAGFIKISDVEWIDLDNIPVKWVRTTTNAGVRRTPDQAAPIISYVDTGKYLRKLNKEREWYRIVLDNGDQVYIHTNDVIETEYIEEPSPQPPSGTVHTVVAGDTLWKIAQKYNTTIAAIVNVNNINPYNYLRIGQKLNIPATAPSTPVPPTGPIQYTIKAGDTLWKIAQIYGVTITELARVNRLNVNNPIYVGDTLIIPKVHIVRYGDTLWKIAQQYNTTINRIATINNLDVMNLIYVGQRILIA